MFTVKQIYKSVDDRTDRGIRLWEAHDVWLETKPHLEPGEPWEQQVSFFMPDGTLCSIDSGIVYVMNGNGKTVETFRLKNSEHL